MPFGKYPRRSQFLRSLCPLSQELQRQAKQNAAPSASWAWPAISLPLSDVTVRTEPTTDRSMRAMAPQTSPDVFVSSLCKSVTPFALQAQCPASRLQRVKNDMWGSLL